MAVAGMGVAATTLQYVTLALNLAPAIIQAGMRLEALAEQVITVVRSEGGPSQADFDALTARRKDILSQLEAQATPSADV